MSKKIEEQTLERSVKTEATSRGRKIRVANGETPRTADSKKTRNRKTATKPVAQAKLAWFVHAWNWTLRQLRSRQVSKRLRVCETVSLGEKRFLAVIEVDGVQFLVGGASSSISTLARLERPEGFGDELKRRWGQDPVQA